MAVAQLALNLIVSGTGVSALFYTRPAVMTLNNAIHLAFTAKAFAGSGQIDAWIQISNDLEFWGFLVGSPPSNPLASFTGPGALQTVVAPGAASPYNVKVGALWVRLAFRVASGTSIAGTFAVRANTFVA